MRFDYWTVRVVPQPMGITSIGVGVIVLDPRTGESDFEFRTDRPYRQSPFAEAIDHALQHLKTEIQALQTPTNHLYLDDYHSLRGHLSFISDHWMNLVRVDPIQSVSAATIAEAKEVLYTTLITSKRTNSRTRTVHAIRSTIRQTYQSLPELGKHTHIEPNVHIAKRELDLNIAVVDKCEILELNQAFNFGSADEKATRARIDTWTLKIEKLQNEGGTLLIPDQELPIAKDVSIVAVVHMPEDSGQRKNFKEFKQYCEELSVQLISETDLTSHATTLEHKLAS